MEFEDVIRLRKSCRKYTDEQISNDDLQNILNAGQLAPIAGADYSMSHITVVQDKSFLEELDEACEITTPNGKKIRPFYNAPTIIVLSVTGPSKDNIEYSNVGCAIENMMLEATNLGLGSVYLWGWLHKLRKRPELIARFNLPEGYSIISALAVGYAADPATSREPEEKIAVDRM